MKTTGSLKASKSECVIKSVFTEREKLLRALNLIAPTRPRAPYRPFLTNKEGKQ